MSLKNFIDSKNEKIESKKIIRKIMRELIKNSSHICPTINLK
nr:MAG TPA: hypothetical protein [Caudoviricetes sp.]